MKRPRLSRLLSAQRGASELTTSVRCRLRGRSARALEVRLTHRQVKRQFIVEIAFEPPTLNKG
jgi:hypothetical protein